MQLAWTEADGSHRCEVVILENLSTSGAGLFTGVAVPQGTFVNLMAKDIRLSGYVRQCVFKQNGYIVGLVFNEKPKNQLLPEHLLDVSLLEL